MLKIELQKIGYADFHTMLFVINDCDTSGACVVQRYSNGLPHDGPGFDSRWDRCIYRASRPSQGTLNGGAVSK